MDQFSSGVKLIQSKGFNVHIPPQIFRKNGYFAGPDNQRAELFMELFNDPGIKAIFCARGGFGSMRILPLIDYGHIRNQPKILVGFSDVTALLAALYVHCDLVTFHGPVVASLPGMDEMSVNALLSAVAQQTPVELSAAGGEVIRSGTGRGPVLAGNLTTLCHLIGTPFQPGPSGHILLFEDRGEAPYRLDRMLTHLQLSGFFDEIAGMAFGYFEDCGDPKEFIRIITDRFKDAPFPVLTGIEFGHGKRNLTVPVGLEATLDTNRRSLTYHASATR
jgi:muramoyltetrapeptide carboxypeptidase